MNTRDSIIQKCREAAAGMRENAIKMTFAAGSNGAHIGSGLSSIDIVATLYCGIMRLDPNNPLWEKRDRFILSKGHGALAYYTGLHAAGIITQEQLMTFEQNGGLFPGQPSKNLEIGVEFSSGSLGLGLSYAVGMALAAKQRKNDYRVFVLLGDGELNEGTNWEAAMSAAHFGLSNIIAVVDANNMQSDGKTQEIMSVRINEIWHGFGWDIVNVEDGHNMEKLYDAFTLPAKNTTPRVVIANTTKGKGISFMENNNEWHHNHLTQMQYDSAILELYQKENDCGGV